MFIFATKLAIKNETVVEKKNELRSVTPQDYYQTLNRKERGKFLRYLISEIGMSYSSATQKLNGHQEMKQTDVVLFDLAISRESEWRR